MTVPWDMSCYSDGPYPKYSCELSFRGMDTDPEIQKFHDKFVENRTCRTWCRTRCVLV